MFDVARMLETVGGLAGGGAAAPADVVDVLAGAGLDPAALAGLAAPEILARLSEAGIDPESLTDGQLSGLLDGLASGDLAGWLEGDE